MDAERLDGEVTGCAAAHQRLLAELDGLTDDQVRADSLLPKWTVGHVLTHVARNADSIIRVFAAAADGRVVDRYERGVAGRNEDIEAGAGRPAAEQVADVRTTIWRLEQAWATAPAVTWHGRSREMSGGEIPVSELLFRRWREVEVHHADLGLGFTFDDWSEAYVTAELGMQLPRLSARLAGATGDEAGGEVDAAAIRSELGDRRFLAWLLGRWSQPGLPPLQPWQ
jgi:maleylpyruvate isomerase